MRCDVCPRRDGYGSETMKLIVEIFSCPPNKVRFYNVHFLIVLLNRQTFTTFFLSARRREEGDIGGETFCVSSPKDLNSNPRLSFTYEVAVCQAAVIQTLKNPVGVRPARTRSNCLCKY